MVHSPHATNIAVLPVDGFNLTILRQSRVQLDLTPATPMHQWFAGKLTNLPTEREITLRIFMAGKGLNDAGYRALMWKWVGLHPLLTYADPTRYASYEWFRRDKQGRWVSGDLFKTGEARFAGGGDVPEQEVIPPALAAQFLMENNSFWQPWREIATTRACVEEERFEMHHRFDAPTATLALHVPYSYTYLQQSLCRLTAARRPGVFVDELGVTRGGRKLQVIRVDDPQHPAPRRIQPGASASPPAAGKVGDKRVMLVIAREHATEHTGSWVVQGILRALLAPDAAHLRKDTTWILIPLFDPDGADTVVMEHLCNRFFEHRNDPDYGNETPGEILAYARYLRAFVNSGRPIDVVTTFYGLECNEGEPVCCPLGEGADLDLIIKFNSFWFKRLEKRGVLTGSPHPWYLGRTPHRLHHWAGYYYGGLPFLFEVGDRHPQQRLHLAGVEALCADFPLAITEFLQTKAGQARVKQTRSFLRERAKNMELWYRTTLAGGKDAPTVYDLLSLGY
jgi:hypothetical protein